MLAALLSNGSQLMRVVMRWLIVPLTLQTMAGIALTFRPLSFNMWESNEGIRSSGDWIALLTGIIFLSSAGWSWYAYAHHRIWCWGFSGLPLLKFCLDVIGLVLLYFVLFRMKSTSPIETTEED